MNKHLIAYIATFFLLTPPAQCDTSLPWSLPDGQGFYPDIIATITNGSGTLNRTEIDYFSNTSCTPGGFTVQYNGTTFSYTSGQRYNANFALAFPTLYSSGAASAKIVVRDTLSHLAFSACLQVSCSSSTACTFTPNTIGLTF